MDSFWETSWKQLDPERLMQYVNGFDQKPDHIIKLLLSRSAHTVCDAGCGCGIYSLKLISHGFAVSGFDISTNAVQIAKELLKKASVSANLKPASVLGTDYADGQFDAVISRDVIDHICKKDGIAAIRELYRITSPSGILIVTLDHLDSEYESEPHIVNADGDYVFTEGKWNGMVFHPYTREEVLKILPSDTICDVMDAEDGILLKLVKSGSLAGNSCDCGIGIKEEETSYENCHGITGFIN